MNLFKISLRPLSLFQTPLRSDTIWGHICWAIRLLSGEDELKKFLDQYKSGSFPIVVSDAFPDGYMPIPKYPRIMKFFEKDKSKFNPKRLKKVKYIPISVYRKLEESFDAFLDELGIYLSKDDTKDDIDNYCMTFDEWHCSINRVTGNVEKGMLFSRECSYFKENLAPVIYVRSTFDKSYIREIFDFIGGNGYGADSSVGRGRFEFQISSDVGWEDSKSPNAFISLSHGFTDPSKFKSCFYEVDIKFGKIGNNISSNPFKKPSLSFKPGSLFLLKDSQINIAYGSIKEGVHKSIDFVHECSLIFPFYVRWQDE